MELLGKPATWEEYYLHRCLLSFGDQPSPLGFVTAALLAVVAGLVTYILLLRLEADARLYPRIRSWTMLIEREQLLRSTLPVRSRVLQENILAVLAGFQPMAVLRHALGPLCRNALPGRVPSIPDEEPSADSPDSPRAFAPRRWLDAITLPVLLAALLLGAFAWHALLLPLESDPGWRDAGKMLLVTAMLLSVFAFLQFRLVWATLRCLLSLLTWSPLVWAFERVPSRLANAFPWVRQVSATEIRALQRQQVRGLLLQLPTTLRQEQALPAAVVAAFADLGKEKHSK